MFVTKTGLLLAVLQSRFLQSNQSEFFDSDYQKGEDADKEEET